LDFKRNEFQFDLTPLPAGHHNPLPNSTASDFPWSSAPAAARHLRGKIAIADILGRGIGCFADPDPIEIRVPDKKPYEFGEDNGRRARGRGGGRGIGRAMSIEGDRPAYP
jgi:hypothetical protein